MMSYKDIYKFTLNYCIQFLEDNAVKTLHFTSNYNKTMGQSYKTTKRPDLVNTHRGTSLHW